MAFLIESTAASRLTTTPRLMPRDSATPMPTTSRVPSSRQSPTTAHTVDVPTSSPTRYRSLRFTNPPDYGFHGNLSAKTHVDVVKWRRPFPERRCDIEIGLQSFDELGVPEADHGDVAFEDDDGIAGIADIHFRHARGQVWPLSQRGEKAGGQRRASSIGGGIHRAAILARGEPVD